MRRSTWYCAVFLRRLVLKRKILRKFIILIAAVLTISGFCLPVKAEENAAFHVQTAEVKDDGTIRVSVYLTDTSNLGGVDAELVYDPSKVTYIGSGLGASFSGGFGETNHLADSSTIKCVTVYSEAKTAHGELMYATFKLNGVESYQPEFRVVDLLDASDDILPIPYSITYQQADGSWADAPDVSGVKAENSVVSDARNSYGAQEDKNIEENGSTGAGEKSAEELLEENGESIEKTEKSEENKEEDLKKENGGTNAKDTEKEKTGFIVPMCIGIAAFVAAVVMLAYLKKRKRK